MTTTNKAQQLPDNPEKKSHLELVQVPPLHEVNDKYKPKKGSIEAISKMLAESAKQVIGEPIEIDPNDLSSKTGEQIINEIREEANKNAETSRLLGGSSIYPSVIPPKDLIIESAGREEQIIRQSFQKKPIVAISSPDSEHPLQKNKDAIVIHPNKNDKTLRIVLASEESETKESPFANSAAITAAHEVSRLRPPKPIQILTQVEKNHQKLTKEYTNKPLSLSVVKYNSKEKTLEIASMGTNHCFILNQKTGRVRSVMNDNKRMPAYQEEYVIIASRAFIDSFGGSPQFQDKAVAKLLEEKLNQGMNLEQALDEFRNKIHIQQKTGKLESTPFTVIGFQMT